jgi:hypothetical protein
VDPRVDLFGDERPDLLARLSAWAATAAVDEAAAARVRERWLRHAAAEEATFAGVLLDLAERAGPVVIGGRGGRRHRGVIRAVGHDFCAVRLADRTDVLLAYAGIASVRPEPRAQPSAGDRPLELAVGLAEALAAIAEDRPRVLVVTSVDTDGVAGELRSVGRDVLTLRLDGAGRPLAYVPLAAVVEVRTA